ncbi:MAG: MFS transporter [Terriglobales bacterium]
MGNDPKIRTTLHDAEPTRARWAILAFIFVISTITYVDRVNISIAARYITKEYGLTDVEMGKIFSAFIFAYGLFQVPGGWLGDRYGPRIVLAGAVVWWSAFTSLTAMAHMLPAALPVVWSLVLIRFFMGAGEAAAWPNFSRTIANWIPQKERGIATSIPLMGGGFGAALTPPLIAWVMLRFGWQQGFHVCAAIGIVAAVGWYWYVRDSPGEHKNVNTEELRLIQGVEPPAPQVRSKTPWKAILTDRNVWLLFCSAASCGYLVYIYMSWFYVYLVEERKLSVMQGSLYTTGPFIATVLITPLGGVISDWLTRRSGKTRSRRLVSMTGMILAAVALVIGVHAANIKVAILGLSIGAGAIYLALAAHWATTIDISKEHAGTVFGVMNWGGNIGGMISPILTPILVKRFGWTLAFEIAALIIFSGAFLWLLVKPERPLQEPPRSIDDGDIRPT